jgi:ubiquinol-cytochrome c reductase cytochrome b subunit
LHYLLPFIIVGLATSHLIILHTSGSTNPLGISSNMDRISFFPYLYLKDLFGLFILIGIFSYFVFYDPNQLNHPDNYIRADAILTPAHIVPE